MLIHYYIEALLADEEAADIIWDAFSVDAQTKWAEIRGWNTERDGEFGFQDTFIKKNFLAQLLEGAGQGPSGPAGRTIFPSEVEVNQAQAALLRGQTGLLQPSFELNEKDILASIAAMRAAQELDVREFEFSSEFSTKTLEETIRANRAQEKSLAKDRALLAASAVADNYLQASQLADARRQAAMAETRLLAPQILPPGTEFIPGFGPDSALSQASEGFGFQFEPLEAFTIPVNPSALANPPTQEQIGPGFPAPNPGDIGQFIANSAGGISA